MTDIKTDSLRRDAEGAIDWHFHLTDEDSRALSTHDMSEYSDAEEFIRCVRIGDEDNPESYQLGHLSDEVLRAFFKDYGGHTPDEDITWADLDHELRGTMTPPQAYADTHRVIIIADEDAATAGSGPCWWGTTCLDRDRAVTDYVQAGGTASHVYVPA